MSWAESSRETEPCLAAEWADEKACDGAAYVQTITGIESEYSNQLIIYSNMYQMRWRRCANGENIVWVSGKMVEEGEVMNVIKLSSYNVKKQFNFFTIFYTLPYTRWLRIQHLRY